MAYTSTPSTSLPVVDLPIPTSPPFVDESLPFDDEILQQWWLERAVKASTDSTGKAHALNLESSRAGGSREPRRSTEGGSSQSSSRHHDQAQDDDSLSSISRHLPFPSSPSRLSVNSNDSYTVRLSPTSSFHVTQTITLLQVPDLAVSFPSSSSRCNLTSVHHYPSALILDPYQLSTRHHDNLLGESYGFFGQVELELPESRLGEEGKQGSALWVRWERDVKEMEVPLHGRYLEPGSRLKGDGERWREVDVEWPWVGWVCEEQVEGEKGSTFDVPSFRLPFPSLSSPSSPFPLHATFHALPLFSSPTMSSREPKVDVLRLPVGDLDYLGFVEWVTAAVVWAVAGWVAWHGWRAFKRLGGNHVQGSRKVVKVE